MTKETLYRCRSHALKYRDLRAELEAVYNTAKSVPFSETPGRSSNKGTGDPTARAAYRAMDLEDELRRAQADAMDAADEVEAWMDEADIEPAASAGIRLYFIVGMEWREIEKYLTPLNGRGGKLRVKSKTEKALTAAGIL